MLQRMHDNGGMQSELADLTGSYLALRRGDYDEMERLGLNAVKKNEIASKLIGLYSYQVQNYQVGLQLASGDVEGATTSQVSFYAKQVDKMVPFELMNGPAGAPLSMGQRAILGQLSSLDPAAARRGEAAVPWTQFSIDVLLTVATLPIGGEGAEAAAGMRALSGEMKVASMGIREVGAAERVFAREVGVFAKEGAAEVGMVAGDRCGGAGVGGRNKHAGAKW